MTRRASSHLPAFLRFVLLWGAWAFVGMLLWWLPGRFPPPAWVTLWAWLHAREPEPLVRWLLCVSQAAALLLAWFGWMGIAIILMHRRSVTHKEARRLQNGDTTPWEIDDTEYLPEDMTSMLQQEEQRMTKSSWRERQGSWACQQPRQQEARVRMVNLLTASSQGTRAVVPLHTLISASSATFDRRPEATAYDLAMSGWCQAGISPVAPEAEDSLLVIGGEAFLSENVPCAVPLGLFALADGVPGPSDRPASSTGRLALATLGESLLPELSAIAGADQEEVTATLHACVRQLNARLLSFDTPKGTALTAALVLDHTAYVISVGHCRAYLYREGEGLRHITSDHAGIMQEARDEEQENVGARPAFRDLYRSLGEDCSAGADHFTVPLLCGDLLLLCTDGCWRVVEPDVLVDLVAGCARRLPTDPFRLAAVLHEQVLERGGHNAAGLITIAVLPGSGAGDPPLRQPGRGHRRHAPRTGQRRRGQEASMTVREGESA